MAREEKTVIRLNKAERHLLARYANEHDVTLPQMLRTILQEYIITREGVGISIYLLRGEVPGDET